MTIDELKEIIDAGFLGTHARLDTLNGRTRQNEIDLGVLQDRSDRAEATTRKAGTLGGMVGAIVGGAIVAIREWWGR